MSGEYILLSISGIFIETIWIPSSYFKYHVNHNLKKVLQGYRKQHVSQYLPLYLIPSL